MELRKWTLKEWEKQVSVDSHQVWKWLKTDCLHRRAARRLLQVNPHTIQHARTRAVTSCWRKHVCSVKNNYSSSRGKSRSTVGVVLTSPSQDRQGQTSPRFYVTLTTAVRVQHEMCAVLDVGKMQKSMTRKPFLFMKSDKSVTKLKANHTVLIQGRQGTAALSSGHTM